MLIQAELDRRLDAARAAEPTKWRQEALERELTRIRKSMERLLTAYQEDLLTLDELRRRMPELPPARRQCGLNVRRSSVSADWRSHWTNAVRVSASRRNDIRSAA
jgi:hypothetical protein